MENISDGANDYFLPKSILCQAWRGGTRVRMRVKAREEGLMLDLLQTKRFSNLHKP